MLFNCNNLNYSYLDRLVWFQGATWKLQDFISDGVFVVLAGAFDVDIAFRYTFDQDVSSVVHLDFDALGRKGI